ncbi:hypothetical protein [Gordonia terrae]
MKNDALKRYTEGRFDALKQYADSRFAIVNARIDDTVTRSNVATLKLECYDLATKATPEPHIDEVLDEAKRLYDWVTGRDLPIPDGSEDLGGGQRWGSSQPAEYPIVG